MKAEGINFERELKLVSVLNTNNMYLFNEKKKSNITKPMDQFYRNSMM